MKFCGEIIYFPKDSSVHTDVCFNCTPSNDSRSLTDSYRKYLHDNLDEWLNNSKGTGAFWVGDPEYFKTWEKE